jgi:hypothetical protein
LQVASVNGFITIFMSFHHFRLLLTPLCAALANAVCYFFYVELNPVWAKGDVARSLRD